MTPYRDTPSGSEHELPAVDLEAVLARFRHIPTGTHLVGARDLHAVAAEVDDLRARFDRLLAQELRRLAAEPDHAGGGYVSVSRIEARADHYDPR